MIGQFFSGRKSASATYQPTPSSFDSALEDLATRQLLFPGANSPPAPDGLTSNLNVPFTLQNGYDGAQGEIDLEFPRDIRIIIAQDELGNLPKTILYDSKPRPSHVESPTTPNARSRLLGGPGAANTVGPSFGGAMHARRSSLVTESTTPRSPTLGAFVRTRARGNSISSMPNIDEHAQAAAQAQAQAQARAKESSIDLAKICLDCMFGNTPMNYRGIGNKLHIVPLDSRTTDHSTAPTTLNDATNSLGRSEGRRRSQLAKSFTPSTLGLPQELPRVASASNEPKQETRRRTIFITRTFSVAPPTEERSSSANSTPTPQSSFSKGNGFPFPRQGAKGGPGKPQQPPPTLKTPMYGITMILHLPVSSPNRPPSRSGHHNHRGSNHLSTSVPGQDSLGSSVDSDRRAGWAFVEPSFGMESFLSTSLHSDVDDRVDVIGQHWDVITRTLTSLQFVVQERILAYFKRQEILSPPIIQQPRAPSRTGNRDGPVHQPRRTMRLMPNALMADKAIREAVELAGERAVRGMKIPRVATGQGKWGVWRDEARWLGKWANDKDKNFFLFNLLTAFLGHHTEWLNQLGPKWYRKRHREQQRANGGEYLTIANRTVIVSPDKMAARRLIFLLSAFLPPNHSSLYDSSSPKRPSTSASLRGYSQSPPTHVPPSRKQSLRRTISRRPRGKQSMNNMRGPQPVGPTGTSPSTPESMHDVTSTSTEVHHRPPHSRCSSAHSVRTSLVIPSMSDSAAATTKSISATVSTITPLKPVPVPHFTLPRAHTTQGSPDRKDRPDSSDSLAANLRHTLTRTGSSSTTHANHPSTDSTQSSRWSIWSLLPNARRDSSTTEHTDHSDILQTTDDGLGIGFPSLPLNRPSPRSTLEQMVVSLHGGPDQHHHHHHDDQTVCEDCCFDAADPYSVQTAAVLTGDSSPEQHALGTGGGGSSGVPASAARPIPAPPHLNSHSLMSSTPPLKLSLNEKDGVIDVDIPLPDFGSPLRSPFLLGGGPPGGGGAGPGYPSSSAHGSSFGESSVLSGWHHGEACEQQVVNVAGWLSEFHADFGVQAIRPYGELERDVRRAMSAEPTPVSATGFGGTSSTPGEQGEGANGGERWVDVCSALIADTRNFTIKQIKLRRLVRFVPTPTYSGVVATPGISGAPNARSQYGNPYDFGMNNKSSNMGVGMGAAGQVMSEVHLKEEFEERVVMDFDPVLIEAVERVLATTEGEPVAGAAGAGAGNKAVGSHGSSRSSSRRGRGERRGGDNEGDTAGDGGKEIEGQDVGGVIFEALEMVVRGVTREMEGSDKKEESGKEGGKEKEKEKGKKEKKVGITRMDSSLREGIRAWLSEVE